MQIKYLQNCIIAIIIVIIIGHKTENIIFNLCVLWASVIWFERMTIVAHRAHRAHGSHGGDSYNLWFPALIAPIINSRSVTYVGGLM